MTTDIFGSDAYAPSEVARRVETVGVAKAQMALLPLAMLGVLAGAFIGLGSVLFVIARADSSLGFAASQLASGVVFSLGLLLVIVPAPSCSRAITCWRWHGPTAGSPRCRCFATGSWCARPISPAPPAWRCWCTGAGTPPWESGAIGRAVVRIALAKQELTWHEALVRGILCNVLVCMAVWMAMAGRSVVDKAVAVVFPITAFVAAGFEHSIANMYLMPLAMLVQSGSVAATQQPITLGGMAANLAVVIAGNLLGGSVLVGLTYHVIYRRNVQPSS